jgi:hypothetical protein
MQADFGAARRSAILARMRTVVAESDPAALITLDDALAAFGRDGIAESRIAEVPVAAIVGTQARPGEFDREFRPRSARVRERWLAVASAIESGARLPPVELTALGELYFVRDGHHRVSVARSLGWPTITASVQRICTVAYAEMCVRLAHLPNKAAERLFLERVPLPEAVRQRLWLDRPEDWLRLADAAEAWGFRRGIDGRRPELRREFAEAWWAEEVLASLAGRPCDGLRDVQRYLALLIQRQRYPDMV